MEAADVYPACQWYRESTRPCPVGGGTWSGSCRRRGAPYGAEHVVTEPHEAVAVIVQDITSSKVKFPLHPPKLSREPEPTPGQLYSQLAAFDVQLMVCPKAAPKGVE